MSSSDAATQLHAQLEESLRSLVTSEDWLQALQVASRFHDYSFANSRLIAAQAHQRGFAPTRVAGYRKWQQLGRQVRRGQHGLQILAPIICRIPPDEAPNPDRDDEERRVVGYRVVHVFDISQTDGKPLPEVTPRLVTGDLPHQWDRLTGLIASEGFTLDFVDPEALGGANGVTSWTDHHVRLRNDLPGAQRFKTAAHELAHIRLHNPKGDTRPDCRGVIEVEAESVAYIISAAVGMDTAGYSLPYVATWSDGDPSVVATTAQRVVTCAQSILPELELDRTIDNTLTPTVTSEPRVSRTPGDEVTVDAERSADRSRLEEALKRAFSHYQQTLQRDEGAPARRHLSERRLTDDIVDRFQLGYAPVDWATITNALCREGFTDQELLDAGISARARIGRLYDRMRGRLIFPIHDHAGRPCGLAGRLIEGDGPKYLNSPQSDLYRKSELLYGHHLARPHIITAGEAIVVEGYTDAIAAHQAGLTNTVALGGTAVTPHHLDALRRSTRRIMLALDGDDAGTKSAMRIARLATDDLDLRISTLPEGRDPADLVATGNLDTLRQALTDGVPVPIHLIDHVLAQHDLEEIEARVRAMRAAGSIIMGISEPNARIAAIDHVAGRFALDPVAAEAHLSRILIEANRSMVRRDRRSQQLTR